MNFQKSENPDPQFLKVVQWDKEEPIDEADVTIHSTQELDALLREVKQFNDDPHHKEYGMYKTIIR